MKTNIHFWSCIAQFFVEWKMFRTKDVEKNLNKHFIFNDFFVENRVFYEIISKNIVESGRPQTIIRSVRFACWLHKATNKRTGCIIIIDLHCNIGCTNASQCYVTVRTLPVQLKVNTILIYRVIHKSLRDFRTRLRNNQDRHGRKEHINR